MRISNIGVKDQFLSQIQYNTERMSAAQKQLTSGQRVELPSQDPIAAINSIYNRTQLHQTTQYLKNASESREAIQFGHDKVGDVTAVLQRIRELAVQGANGTFNKDDREYMAIEVEQLLKEVIQNANANQGDRYLFAGSEEKTKPFREFTSSQNGLNRPLIDRIEYQGNDREHEVEVDRGDKVAVGLTGNNVFWGNQHVVVSLKDSKDYVANADQTIRIDGQEVKITSGDNLDTVIQKISEAVPSVNAFKRELPDGRLVFAIESSYPHRIQMEDIKGGTVMQDLGVIREGKEGQFVGNNIHPNTLESGGSIFDIIIRFRNSLLKNQQEDIGGRDLRDLSSGIDNMLLNQARLSANANRLEMTEKKLARDQELTTERLSKNEDVDVAQASIKYSEMENIHRISLMTASKLVQPTLLDYLR